MSEVATYTISKEEVEKLFAGVKPYEKPKNIDCTWMEYLTKKPVITNKDRGIKKPKWRKPEPPKITKEELAKEVLAGGNNRANYERIAEKLGWTWRTVSSYLTKYGLASDTHKKKRVW